MTENLITTLWYYFGVINALLFIIMGIDKLKAIKGRRRIPEKTLFLFAIFGGATGGTLGMLSFRHKTKHWYFAVFFPILMALDIAALTYILIKFA